MTLNLIYSFYFLSFLCLLSALMVVFSKNPVYSVLYLIITLFSISGHYILLNAQFLAAVHVIVYAGAIMVLFLYVIMLLNLNNVSDYHKHNLLKMAAAICAGSLLVVMVASIKGSELMAQQHAHVDEIGLVKNLGRVLFKEFLLPFEVSSILLLTAMVGAIMLGNKNKEAK